MPCRLHPRDFVVYLHSYQRALTTLEAWGVPAGERERRAKAYAWARVVELNRDRGPDFSEGERCSADEASYERRPPSVASFFMGPAARGRKRRPG